MTEVAQQPQPEHEEPVADDMRELLVKTNVESFKLTIPKGWKITFSKVNPQSGGYGDHALRIYEADDKQRACFTGVTSFRDLAIPLQRRVKKVNAHTERADNGRGRTKREAKVETEFEWVDEADAPDNDIPF